MHLIAPEVVRGEAVPSTQTDLFSLAVLLFYLFHVHHPPEGSREVAIGGFDLSEWRAALARLADAICYCGHCGAENFHFGATIGTAQANYDGNYAYGQGQSRKQTVPVGSLPANPWGLHEVHGNVWEWCEDCWNDTYQGAPTDGSASPHGDCDRRVSRGGAWFDQPEVLRSAYSVRSDPGNRSNGTGFRPIMTLTA